MKKILNALVCASLLTLAACAQGLGQDVYSESELGKQVDIDYGVIKSIKPVKVKKDNTTGIGAVGGATAGGVAGAQVGNGNGQVAGAVAGLLIGAIAGEMAEKKLGTQEGFQYIIRKENGKTVSIVQVPNDGDKPFHVGQKVMIQTSGEYQKASSNHGGHGAQFQRILPIE